MRILYLSDHTPHNNSFIRQDIEHISTHHTVSYFGFLTHEDVTGSYQTKLIKYPHKSFKSKVNWRLEKLNLSFSWKSKAFSKVLNQEIAQFNPDIIHCQFLYESAKLIQNVYTSIPIVINVRGYGATHKMRNTFYRKWLNKIALFDNIFLVYVSKSLKNELKSQNIHFKNKGIVLYTGIDTKKFRRINYKKSEVTIFIQVGSFNEKKGQLYTIKAFEKLLKRKNGIYKLVLIGEGKNLEICKSFVRKRNLSKSIIFKGNLDHKNIINELNNADVFVHHSITAKNGDKEGIPNAIAEAMSMEMPILSTYHSGIPELVKNGVNGYLCEEKDIETYSNLMHQISKWNFIKENRIKIKSQFEINLHIDKLLNFYDEIMQLKFNSFID